VESVAVSYGKPSHLHTPSCIYVTVLLYTMTDLCCYVLWKFKSLTYFCSSPKCISWVWKV